MGLTLSPTAPRWVGPLRHQGNRSAHVLLLPTCHVGQDSASTRPPPRGTVTLFRLAKWLVALALVAAGCPRVVSSSSRCDRSVVNSFFLRPGATCLLRGSGWRGGSAAGHGRWDRDNAPIALHTIALRRESL